MGNFHSSNAIIIQLNKPQYCGGELLEGNVALNCVSPLTTSGINLEVHGYEETSFTTYDGGTSDGNSDPTRWHSGRNNFFKVVIPIGPPGVLTPGQYQFGFKLPLPDSLPPAFHTSHGGDSGAVRYKIKAYVAKSGFDVKGEIDCVIVDVPLSPQQARPAGNAAQQEVTMCCCCGKGTAMIQINLPSDNFYTGAAVAVAVQARNDTSSTFDTIHVRLRRMVKLFSSTRRYERQQYNKVIVDVPVQGLRAKESAEGGSARNVTLEIPGDAPPTLEGQLVQCYYMVEVELKGGVGLSSVKTQVPIRIISGGTAPLGGGVSTTDGGVSSSETGVLPPSTSTTTTPTIGMTVEAPEGWKPQVFPTVNIPAPPPPPPGTVFDGQQNSSSSSSSAAQTTSSYYQPPPQGVTPQQAAALYAGRPPPIV